MGRNRHYHRVNGHWLTEQGFIDDSKSTKLELFVSPDGDTAKHPTYYFQDFADDGEVTVHAETYGASGTYIVVGMRCFSTTLAELARIGMVPRQMRRIVAA